jgi:hypothetical protein
VWPHFGQRIVSKPTIERHFRQAMRRRLSELDTAGIVAPVTGRRINPKVLPTEGRRTSADHDRSMTA